MAGKTKRKMGTKATPSKLFPREQRATCIKVTILDEGFATRVGSAAETSGYKGEASVKTRFRHQTQTTAQVRQAGGLYRGHDGVYQAALRSREAAGISEGDPEKCVTLRLAFGKARARRDSRNLPAIRG